jgi:hypothetical protein
MLHMQSPRGWFGCGARPARARLLILGCFALATFLTLPLSALPAAAGPLAHTGAIYYSQTKHNLSNGFLSYWLWHGQAARWGYPITEELQQDGMTVQYLERGRLEYDPKAPKGAQVRASNTGSLLIAGRQFPPAVPIKTTSTAIYFPQAGHTIKGGFYQYWKKEGGLDSFGYPITEEFTEGGHTVQYFQKARFELTRNGGIWLGHIGRELLDRRNARAAAVAAAPPEFAMQFNGGATWFPGNWNRIIALNETWGNLPGGYRGYGYYAAMPADLDLVGRWARVSRGSRSIWVQFVDVIDWKDIAQVRADGKVIDLGKESFAALAPLSDGVVRVQVDVAWPGFHPSFAR